MFNKEEYISFLPDTPIEDIETEDAFGYKQFVEVLEQVIEKYPPPFNIALFGKWGIGKSSIGILLQKELKKNTKNYKFLIFNAWKYTKEALRRKFLIDVAKEFGISKKKIYKKLYADIKKRKVDLHSAFIWGLSVLGILVFGTFLLYRYFISRNPQIGYGILSFGTSISVFLAMVALIFRVFKEFTAEIIIGKPETPEQFELIMEEFLAPQKLQRNPKKLVVFIDDLDRCNEEEILEVLGTLKTFLETTNRSIFIVAADDEVIKHAVRKNMPLTKGGEYLDKLFQITLRLPPLEKFDFRKFADDLIEKKNHKLKQTKEKERNVYNDILSFLIHPGIDNPRMVKRLINNYMVLYSVAQSRKIAYILEHLPFLAKLTVLQTEYPKFYEDLKKSRRLVEKVAEFQQDKNVIIFDSEEKEILREYVEMIKDDQLSNNPKENYKTLWHYLEYARNPELDKLDVRPFIYLKKTVFREAIGDELIKRVEDAAIRGSTGAEEVIKLLKMNRERSPDILRNLLEMFVEEREMTKENILEAILGVLSNEEIIDSSAWKEVQGNYGQEIGRVLSQLDRREKVMKDYPPMGGLRIAKSALPSDRASIIDFYIESVDSVEKIERKHSILASLINYEKIMTRKQKENLSTYLADIKNKDTKTQEFIIQKIKEVNPETRKSLFVGKFLAKLVEWAIEPIETKEEGTSEEGKKEEKTQ